MAKQTEKKEFAWDTEKLIGVNETDKLKIEVRICTLNGNTYVSSTAYVASTKAKGGWKRTKNNSMKMEVFKEVQGLVADWELKEAFGSTEELKAPAKPKKPTRKETDKAISKALKTEEEPKKSSLKAKKQAQGAKEKATRKKKETR